MRYKKMKEKIYAFTYANGLGEGHRYTDDVAICKAKSLDEAIAKFSALYSNANKNTVKECITNSSGVCNSTDY